MAAESQETYSSDMWEGPWGCRGGNSESFWEGRGTFREGPWGGRGGGRGRGGFFRGGRGRGGFPFFDSRRDFMDFYAPDFDFQYHENDLEDPRPHPLHRRGHHHYPCSPRAHAHRPGHLSLGRRDNHSFTVEVYPFQAKSADVRVEDKNLTITSKGDNHQTVQSFKLPEHRDSVTWKVDQETTDTTVILMTRDKTKE